MTNDAIERRGLAHTVTLLSVAEQPPEAWYWRNATAAQRIEAVEQTRREYHGWKQDDEPRLERVARIVECA